MGEMKRGDRVYTPRPVVRDMIKAFGVPDVYVLEPFKGGGAFTDERPLWAWCEIDEGRDFLDWNQPIGWIVSNPPYSKLRPVWNHAAKYADNIVFLIPFRNWVSGAGFVRETQAYGNPVHIRVYGTGGSLGFPMGNCIVGVHWKRDYRGGTTWSDYATPTAPATGRE